MFQHPITLRKADHVLTLSSVLTVRANTKQVVTFVIFGNTSSIKSSI